MKKVVLCLTLLLVGVVPARSGQQDQAQRKISIDATLYKKHQVCLADVRKIAGEITEVKINPSVNVQGALEELMICLYWDDSKTPFIACSLGDFLSLFDLDGTPKNMPNLIFSNGFRLFAECPVGRGGKLQGHIIYEPTSTIYSTMRVRFDPGVGITTPQVSDSLIERSEDIRLGRGELVEIPNAGFESGVLDPWQDNSWGKREFGIYPSGTEGVCAHSGKFVAGTVRRGGCEGLIRVGGLIPGYQYRLSAWFNTWGKDKDGWVDKVKVRLGINTRGLFLTSLAPDGADLWTTDYSHQHFYFPHCWGPRLYPHSHDHWSSVSVDTRAEGRVASIFLCGSQLIGGDLRRWCLFDDVRLQNVPVPMGRIEGRIIKDDGKGVKQAFVITDPYGFAIQVRRDGRFELEDVPEGVYNVTARNNLGVASVNRVRVLRNRTAEVEFVLGDSPSGRIHLRTPGDDENQLINGDFESGDPAGWQLAYDCGAAEVAESTRRVAPPDGRFMFGGEQVYHFAGVREIIYQHIPVKRGTNWTFSGQLFAHSEDGSADGATCCLVADPAQW
jgi:hypothetical protein